MYTVTQAKYKIREITNTTASDYSDASLIRDLNSELSAVRIHILRDRGVLEHDDPNFTNLPVATFPVNGTTYKLTEDEDGILIQTIHKVTILVDGTEYDIPRVMPAEGSQEWLITQGTARVPECYYEVGKSIVLSHTPTGGTLKIWFDRELGQITTSDTTKMLPVPPAYHNLVAYKVSLNYAIDKGLSNQGSINQRVMIEEQRLAQYEENRRVDEQTVISPEVISGI
jgi:hypothetical protein